MPLFKRIRGNAKFNQSVELAINFTGIDMSKQDNRLNLEVKLPNGKGKQHKVIVFADDKNIAGKAQPAGATVIPGSELPTISTDKTRMNELLARASCWHSQASCPRSQGRWVSSWVQGTRCQAALIGVDVSKAVQDTANPYI